MTAVAAVLAVVALVLLVGPWRGATTTACGIGLTVVAWLVLTF